MVQSQLPWATSAILFFFFCYPAFILHISFLLNCLLSSFLFTVHKVFLHLLIISIMTLQFQLHCSRLLFSQQFSLSSLIQERERRHYKAVPPLFEPGLRTRMKINRGWESSSLKRMSRVNPDKRHEIHVSWVNEYICSSSLCCQSWQKVCFWCEVTETLVLDTFCLKQQLKYFIP